MLFATLFPTSSPTSSSHYNPLNDLSHQTQIELIGKPTQDFPKQETYTPNWHAWFQQTHTHTCTSKHTHTQTLERLLEVTRSLRKIQSNEAKIILTFWRWCRSSLSICVSSWTHFLQPRLCVDASQNFGFNICNLYTSSTTSTGTTDSPALTSDVCGCFNNLEGGLLLLRARHESGKTEATQRTLVRY